MPDKIFPRNRNESHGNKMASNNIYLGLTVILFRMHITETFVSLKGLLGAGLMLLLSFR